MMNWPNVCLQINAPIGGKAYQTMRKEVKFELVSAGLYLIGLKNVFGDFLNQVEDRIKKNGGVWCVQMRRFKISADKAVILARQLRDIERALHIEMPPLGLDALMNKIANTAPSKTQKIIILDNSMMTRYQNVNSFIKSQTTTLQTTQTLLTPLLASNSSANTSSSLDSQHSLRGHILVICPLFKLRTWCEIISPSSESALLPLTKQQSQMLRKSKLKKVWVLPFERITYNALSEFVKLVGGSFVRIFVDQIETLCTDQNLSKVWDTLKSLLSKNSVSFIVSNCMQGQLRFHILLKLLPFLFEGLDFPIFERRYSKDNLNQLTYILNTGKMVHSICQQKSTKKHHFNRLYFQVADSWQNKIKSTCKKFSSLDQKKLLTNISMIKTKPQRQFYHQVTSLLVSSKMGGICEAIRNLVLGHRMRCVILVQSAVVYQAIENYLCKGHEIDYCHYEHPKSVNQFNKNPNLMVCLIRVPYLRKVKFGVDLKEYFQDEMCLTDSGEQLDPIQYQCFGKAHHVIFPDPQWCTSQLRSLETALWSLFRYCNRPVIRHYFINKGSYEQKWIESLQEGIIKIHLTLNLKQQMLLEEEEEKLVSAKNESAPEAFMSLIQADVDYEFQLCPVSAGVLDIDEQFDRVQFQAMKQKEMKKFHEKSEIQQENSQSLSEIAEIVGKNQLSPDPQQLESAPVFYPVTVERDSPPQETNYRFEDEHSKKCDIFLLRNDSFSGSDLQLQEIPDSPKSPKYISLLEAAVGEQKQSACPQTKNQSQNQLQIIQIGNRKLRPHPCIASKKGPLKVFLRPSQ